ncbi:hypothetical protein I4U23_007038 [Adineta vaga]|nr:hypothetical protein I4U23_007038 [Adineta vaga]
MTRNYNSKNTSSPTRSTRTDFSSTSDNFVNLPDLSGLKEEEKRHILNVLLRDENLRNKHLARFMQLRKEVADLEQKPQTTSTSVCARCQTAFGFIFNTGDACPKCGAKVCKQCRLMYNVNDNGWLCQLCCKQMQLMSYSGEWIYSFRSNLRKDSITASEIIRKSLTPSVSMQDLNQISSSDTETESTVNSSENRGPRLLQTRFSQPISSNNGNRMIVQSLMDEEKLNSLKKPASRRSTHQESRVLTKTNSNILTGGSSDDVDSVFDHSPNQTTRMSTSSGQINNNNNDNDKSSQRDPVETKRLDSSSTMQTERDYYNDRNKVSIDCASVTSSEWGGESERGESVIRESNATKKRGSKKSLASRVHLGGSIQSLRDAVHSKRHISASRTSLNSTKPESADTTSMKMRESTIKDDLQPLSNNHHKESTNTLVSTNSTLKQIRSENFGSVGHLEAADSDDDDDIDKTFEEAKLEYFLTITDNKPKVGSQLSLNSVASETKAHYGLDVTGTIELKLTYALVTGAFDVYINSCKNLAKAKKSQTSDPFVKVYLLPDRSKNSKRKSGLKKNTIDPVFDEKFRYHVTKQEFETRVLWISVWSLASLGHNDFLGEIHIPLANCTLDTVQEYPLMAQKKKNDLAPNIEPTMDPAEIIFQLTFIENAKNKDIGTIQVHNVQAKSIFFGKHQVDAVCKGVLMPDKVKRKIPNLRKGPTPKWEIPLRWEGIRRDNLKNTSIEISIWIQERFRKFMFGFVRLNLAQGHFDNKPVTWSDSTKAEKVAWQKFIQEPTRVHHFQLPLRPATIEHK